MTAVAIVTGASSGIGRATALRLAAAGYDIGLTFNNGPERALEVVSEIERLGRRTAVEQVDLSRPRDGIAAIDHLADALGRIDVFVNNAGINHRRSFLEMPLAEFEEVMSVNLTGAFVCAQRAAQRMVADGTRGSVVNVTSILDREILEGGSAYCSSKAALRQLTRVMAFELAPYGIRVNGVAPGETATPMNSMVDADVDLNKRPIIPLVRSGRSDEIAQVIAYLLSDAAAYVTGEVMLVDGGLSLHGGPNALQLAVGRPRQA